MFKVKAIKPKALNVRQFAGTLNLALYNAGKQIKKDFEGTVKTWDHKPEFEVTPTNLRTATQWIRKAEVEVTTDDEIYGFVDRGTKPHVIMAGIYTGKSKKKSLAFPSVWAPKSKPGNLRARRGFKGKVDTFVPSVHHPGTEARGSTKMIAKNRKGWFKDYMQQHLNSAARKSGHSI